MHYLLISCFFLHLKVFCNALPAASQCKTVLKVNVFCVLNVAAFAHQHVLGCLGSIATLTMGVASKLIGVKGGQAGDVEMVADLRMNSSMPPIPAEIQTALN